MRRLTRVRPRVAAAAVVGRLRADRWPLLLTTAVLVLTTGLAVATPRLIQRTADDAIAHAVTAAGESAVLRVVRPLTVDPMRPRTFDRHLGVATAEKAELADRALPPTLGEALAEPVTTITTSSLVARDELGEGRQGDVVLPTVRMYHLWRDGPPAVEWVDGRPPRSTLTVEELRELTATDAWSLEAAIYEGSWQVEVALAHDVAGALALEVDDHWALTSPDRSVQIDLVVSGVFRAADPSDPVWSHTPGLLEPRVVGSSLTRTTQVAGLLSDDSLPAAVFVMPLGSTSRVVTFTPDASALDAHNAAAVAAEIASMKAADGVGRFGQEPERTDTELDAVLIRAQTQIHAATAQAAVLLAGILVVAVMTLVLTGRLLAHRRVAVLGLYRVRGATLGGIVTELGVEAVLVAAVGCSAGVLLANALVPGPVPWAWLVPVVAVAVVGAPVLGTRQAARATGGRRTAANEHDRRSIARDRMVGRIALDVAVVLLGAGAVAGLRARGGTSTAGGVDPVLALAPTVAALAGGVLLLRVLPPLLRWALGRATRSRGLLPVLAIARAHATAGHTLAFVTLTVAVGLSGLSAAVAATIEQGQIDGSWAEVGADVTVITDPDPALGPLASVLATDDGVTTAVVGRVDEHAQVFGPWGSRIVRVVALPATAYEQMLAETPLPDAPQLVGLAESPAGDLPALVSPDLEPSGGAELSLLWGDVRVDVAVIGSVPPPLATAPDGGAADTLVVDIAALEAASGVAVDANRLWVVGPDAEAATAGTPELAGAELSTRGSWLSAQRAEPLTLGLINLVRATTALLLLFTVLAVVLGSSTGASQRGRTLAALRTLGIGGRGARLIGLGELLPGIALAALGGGVLGAGLALAVTGPLELRLVTSQPVDPRIVVPWAAAAPVAAAVASVGVVVLVESLLRRRERLGEILRIGNE